MSNILIIGSGGAGLASAISARQNGAKVTVISKNMPTQAQTSMAQGGINAALGNIEPDSIDEHIKDTLISAHSLADKEMVKKLCSSAPETIEWLDSLLVPFSRLDSAETPLKSIAQRRLGGASHPRACYAQDYTGLKILQSLYDRAISMGVEFISEYYLLDLITNKSKEVSGATFWDIKNGEIKNITASHTILATGGFSAIYYGYSTNTYGAVGDGIASALRAGAKLSNMEMVQFHPTAIDPSSVLISESARGAGGKLILQNGERFIDELASRDIVSRAIYEKIKEGNRVYLDLTSIPAQTLKELMPQELRLAKIHAKIDATKEPIPIKPVAHYTMGGICVDRDFKVKGLSNLYAVGECSDAHIHGANRLGGNSLLEIISFAKSVGEDIASKAKNSLFDEKLLKENREKSLKKISDIYDRVSEENFYTNQKELGEKLYKNAGIVREEESMNETLNYIKRLQSNLSKTGLLKDKSKENNQTLIELLEYENTLILSEALLKSALYRKESRGAHYRSDYPKENSIFEKDSITLLEDGEILCK